MLSSDKRQEQMTILDKHSIVELKLQLLSKFITAADINSNKE
ncbi:hypothetical protein NBRC111894_4678 [Sporolactobacillus inulinus]|uniref:Uncharacterized protein n=1 Tax=Sporolactobacillus inulinus TaxID=2078 RepID=A0A4Y1ZJI7_9BACL|nr:hypothetical protein NBRC111894_4678 [Sporolactobacillus inulinus]